MLLIGDEFDTSVRKTSHGIFHYNGLFDQSIYFDQTITNFFMRKGWAVSQFSILRPLSELLKIIMNNIKSIKTICLNLLLILRAAFSVRLRSKEF